MDKYGQGSNTKGKDKNFEQCFDSNFILDYPSSRWNNTQHVELVYVALSMAMRCLFPFKRLVQTIFTGVGLEKTQQFNIWCSVFEDNSGARTLANFELPRITPRSEHYAVRYHWFRACL